METTQSRHPGRPAVDRTSPLDREAILTCAMAIVDSEGRDELSMRRLAKELGVTPMAVYHYIPDKPALMEALVERVWQEIFMGMPPFEGDPVERLIQSSVRVREVWLRHGDLANLAVAVSEPDDTFFELTKSLTETTALIGFPDVALAYSAVQNFTMGSIQTNANRRTASSYFGRDPEAIQEEVGRLMDEHCATPNHRGVVEARFDDADDAHFEPSLRSLINGLLAAAPSVATRAG